MNECEELSCASCSLHMKKIIGYLLDYIQWVNKPLFFSSALFIACSIFINYYFGLNDWITSQPPLVEYFCWLLVFLIAFSFTHLIKLSGKKNAYLKDPAFLLLFFAAPAIFAWKMAASVHFQLVPTEAWNVYWNKVIYWPWKLAGMMAVLFLLWKNFHPNQKFYGLSTKEFNAKPYLIMLFIMLPLIAAASTQQDFLSIYPKIKNIAFLKNQEHSGWLQLLYELSYGSDFLGIEIFFRGFLVLAFVQWLGKDAILPMALFYCTIHFGKPVGECISSFFGGLLLGVVTYHTRSIYGGLIVHLGIAWLMELGGYLGHQYFL